jgi:hypothetical protein
LEEMPNVSQSNYCNYYDLERMSSVLEESARIAQGGQVPSELMSIYEVVSSKKK